MARPDGRELEPLVPTDALSGEAVAAVAEESPRGRVRVPRWLVAVGLGLLVVVVVAAVVQGGDDGRAQRRAAATFEQFEGADAHLADQTNTIASLTVPDEQPGIDLVVAQAERSQAHDDQVALDALHAEVWQDGATRRLVDAVRTALSSRIADLSHLAAWREQPAATRGPQPANPSDASTSALEKAQALVARHVVHVSDLPPNTYLEEEVVRLSQWSDSRTGSTLAVANESGVALLDVDASTAIDLQLAGTSQAIVPRAGYVAAITPVGDVFGHPLAAGGPSIMLGEGDEILPARQPDAVWLVAGSGPTTVTEIDGSAHRVVDPVLVPKGALVTSGVTDEGLVLDTGAGLFAWDPVGGRQVRITPPGAAFLAASGDLVAWQGEDAGIVFVTNLVTDREQALSFGSENMTAAALDPSASPCAFSPDEARLACPIVAVGALGLFRVGVVDLGDGSVAVPSGALGDSPAHPLAWSPDGSRLWWVVPTSQASLLATWRVGQPSASELRYRSGNWLVGLAVTGQS